MRKMSRKSFLQAVAATGVASAMASCSSDSGSEVVTGEAAAELAAEGDSTYTPVGEYPVVQDGVDITITAFGPLRSSTTSYDIEENLCTQWLDEKTGVHLSFQTCLEVDAQQKLNTIMVGGDFPDILLFSGNYPMTPSELLLYGEQGSLMPLNDLIDNYMPNLLDMFEQYPDMRDTITLSDGNIYTLPQIGTSRHTYNQQRMWINTAWLDEVGLDMPTTTQEFYDVMLAFKDKDPSGTGKVVPLSGSLAGWNTSPVPYLMNSFCHYNVTSDNAEGIVIDDDGKVVYPQVTDGWKEGLKYMNSLYEAGLMDDLTFTQTSSDLKALGDNPDVAILGASCGGSIPQIMTISDNDRWLDYKMVPPLLGPDGFRCSIYSPDTGSAGLSITSACKDPIAVVRMFDVNYDVNNVEGLMHNIQGELGIDYLEAEDGELNYIGEQASFVRITASASVGNNAWSQLGPWGRPTNFELMYTADPTNIEYVLYNEAIEKYEPYTASIDNLIMPMAMSEDQSRVIVDVEVPMSSYVNQCTAEFVMGQKDIDAEWDNYVATVESYGLADYLATYQECVDALK